MRISGLFCCAGEKRGLNSGSEKEEIYPFATVAAKVKKDLESLEKAALDHWKDLLADPLIPKARDQLDWVNVPAIQNCKLFGFE